MRFLLCYFAITIIFCSVRILNAQFPVQPLEKYVPKEGKYALIGLLGKDDHPLQKQLGEFYIDDREALDKIKTNWNFPLKPKGTSCGEHYYIVLTRDGMELSNYVISLDCDLISDGGISGSFHKSFLTNIAARRGNLVSRFLEFKTVSEARNTLSRIKKDKEFLFLPYEPLWATYEGKFRFRVPCPAAERNCYEYGRDGTIVALVRNKIATEYPSEKFDLLPSGGTASGDVFIDIYCDKSLETKFDLYYRWDKKGFGKWDPFYLGFTSYWKSRGQK